MNKELEKKIRECHIEDGEIIKVEWLEEVNPQFFNLQFVKADNLCHVVVKLHPAPESDITVEMFLPDRATWNGKFLGTGNGGYAGSVNLFSLLNGASRGYATACTDMGTTQNPDDCIGKPDKWEDFGHRATHLMTVVGKKLTECFYEKAPEYSYFIGGSTGGQQALSEAQRYPEDYDGIVCFAPAYDRVRLHSFFIWNWQALHGKEGAAFNVETAKTLNTRIVEQYAKRAGNAPGDNFLAYPGRVQITVEDLKELGEGLMTPEQLEALEKIYAGPVDSVTGEPIISPFIPGNEGEELSLVSTSDREKFAFEFFYLFRWIWGKDFDFMKFDFHKDLQAAVEKLSKFLDATNPDLSTFKARKGKLLMISGASDAIIPYNGALQYYQQVIERQGSLEATKEFYRYFLVPGFAHTFGGPGVQELGNLGLKAVPRDKEHDAICALEAWVEHGEAPDRLLATAFVDNSLVKDFDHVRPAYVYPYVAEYVGGDPKIPENFRPVEDIQAY